ncbi:MAG: RNA polymerase sigma factor [Emcibacteraceae bacterium]|nr:RNA polymerase sigma factor [Emcibacteraceae bacterium]
MRDIEKQWIRAAIINKDTKYFGYLVEEHQVTVRGYLRRLTKGSMALADDLAQETFLTAFRKISTYKNTGTFKSWLLAIAYHNFLQHIRKNSNNPHMNFPLDDYEAKKLSQNSDAIFNKIDIEKAFLYLKKNERSTLTLCYSYGMSHSEISKIMDMPLGTVKSHILRGKNALKKILNPVEEDILC